MTTPNVNTAQGRDVVKLDPARPLTTGQLRATLQPIIFVRILEDSQDTALRKGDLVTLQFWGNGQVAVTRMTDLYRTFRTPSQLTVSLVEPAYEDPETNVALFHGRVKSA